MVRLLNYLQTRLTKKGKLKQFILSSFLHLYLSSEWQYIVLLLYIKLMLNYARKVYISANYCTGLRPKFPKWVNLLAVVLNEPRRAS